MTVSRCAQVWTLPMLKLHYCLILALQPCPPVLHMWMSQLPAYVPTALSYLITVLELCCAACPTCANPTTNVGWFWPSSASPSSTITTPLPSLSQSHQPSAMHGQIVESIDLPHLPKAHDASFLVLIGFRCSAHFEKGRSCSILFCRCCV